MGPETYKGLPSAFVFSNRLRGLGTVRSVTGTATGRLDQTHCISRGELMLPIAMFEMLDVL